MTMPRLGPPAPTAFTPLDQTQPIAQQPQQAAGPSWSSPGDRVPGTWTNPIPGFNQKPYEPPAWAQSIPYLDTNYVTPGAGHAATGAYQQPGFPERATINPFSSDPIRDFFGGQGAQVALGMAPGEQRGGAYNGIATAPITLANFATYGREGLLAALLDITGSGDAWQQPEGARFGQQPTGNPDSGNPVEWFTQGAVNFGNLVWSAVDAPMKWYRDSNAFNRGKNVRELFQKGETNGFITERVTSLIFGGSERFTMDGIRKVAAQRGIDTIDTIAALYDMPREKVAEIAANPYMPDDALGQLTDGTPLSQDMLSNLALEGGMLMATMAVGGWGMARGAAVLGKAGFGIADAFGAGLRGAAFAEDAGRALSAARTVGTLTRRAMQLNSFNTIGGWSIRGAELGIKQLGIIAGNDELVKAMDRMLWTMPLSMNPGWNLIDGFTTHPIDTAKSLWREGAMNIGRPTSPGYVGVLDIAGRTIRDVDGKPMTVTLAGRKLTLSAGSEEYRALGRLAELTPDDLHAQFFHRLGWTREALDTLFGDGNPNGLTWNDARNGLFHAALEAVREAKGQIGKVEGLHLGSYAERTAAFVRDNAKGALKMLEDNFTGKSDAMVKLFKNEDLWDLAKRNDSARAPLKARLGDAYDPALALADFASWLRASKLVHEAIKGRIAADEAVPVYRRTVNRAFVASWRSELAKRFAPDEVVPPSFIDRLKQFGGAVEERDGGLAFTRNQHKPMTRSQIETVLDQVEASDDAWQRKSNNVPHAEAAAFRRGFDMGQDPLEDARVLDIPVSSLETIKRAMKGGDDKLTSPPPPALLAKVAKALNQSVDRLRAKGPVEAWHAVFDWYESRLQQATETAHVRNALEDTATSFQQRVAAGEMDPAIAGPAINALNRIRDEILQPLDKAAAERRGGSLWNTWEATRQEAVVLAEELRAHLDAPERGARTAPVPATGGVHFVPPGVSANALVRFEELAQRIASRTGPQITDADRAFLQDTSIHPFAKAEVMRRSVTPGDMVDLSRLENELGGRPEERLQTALNDLTTPDPADPAVPLREGADQATSRTLSYAQQAEELAGRAQQLAQRFRMLGGTMSDEMASTLDRLLTFDPVFRRNTPKGTKRMPLAEVSMDPESPAAAAARYQRDLIAEADRSVAAAEARLAAAQRAVDDPATPWIPSAREYETLTFDSTPIARFAKGKGPEKEAAARQFAAEWNRSNPPEAGRAVAERRPGPGNHWWVRRTVAQRPPVTVADTRVPPFPFDLQRLVALERDVLAGKETPADFYLSTESAMELAIKDPRSDPALAEAIKQHTLARRKELEGRVQNGEPMAAALLSTMDERLGWFEQRKRTAQQGVNATPAENPPVAEPTRVDSTPLAEGPGNTAPPRADVSTPSGALEAPGQQPISDGTTAGDVTAFFSGLAGAIPRANSDQMWRVISDGRTEGKPGGFMHALETEGARLRDAGVVTDAESFWSKLYGPAQQRFAAGERDPQVVREIADALAPGQQPPEPAPAVIGERRSFPDPTIDSVRPVPFELRAVEASQLVNSWDEGYPQQFQMKVKRREDVIAGVAQNPRPESLLITETGAEGAPILLPDGRTVMAGNHRVEGLRLSTDAAYAPVKNALVNRAAEFGLNPDDVARMNRPVLVRVLTDEAQATPKLANALNGYSGGMSPAEYAKTVADTLTPADWRTFQPGSGTLDDALAQEQNKPFLNRVQQALPESERPKVIDEKGAVQPYGITIAKAALIGRVLGTTTDPLVGRLANTVGKKATVVNGLLRSMPDLAAAEAKMSEGIRPRVPFQQPLREALRLAMNAPDLEKLADPSEMDQFLAGVFGETDFTTQSLAKELIGLVNDMEPQRQAPAVARFLDHLAAVMEELPDPTQPTLLDGAPATEVPFPRVANEAVRRWNAEEEQRGGLLGGHQMGLIAESDGVRIARDGNGTETARITPVVEDSAPAIEAATPVIEHLAVPLGEHGAGTAADIARTTGPVTFVARTRAEADMLQRYLGGDDTALPPRTYRVVGDTLQPMGDLRSEVGDRITGRYRSQDSQTAGLRYLEARLRGDEPPPTPPNIVKFVDSELAFRQGPRPVPMDPHLPAIRDALAGLDWRVETVGEAAVPEEAPRPTGYFNGDRFEYLGTSQEIHGGTFYDVLMLEGRDAGQQKVVKNPPPEAPAAETPAAPPAPRTVISRGRPRSIDPAQPTVTGVPATNPAELAVRESAARGDHRVVDTADQHVERAEQVDAGAPRVHQESVIQRNIPDQTRMRAAAEAARDKAAAELEAVRQKRARLAEKAPDEVPPTEVLRGEELALWNRYIADGTNLGMDRQPRTVGDVSAALRSLDSGVPPLVGTMTDAEMVQLRGALFRILHSRLDELGAPRETPRVRGGRAGAGARPDGVRHRSVHDEPVLTTPEDLSVDLADVMREMQGRVWESDDPLAGWEGTQYEIGMLPRSARDGGPLAPRIQYAPWVDKLDEVVPGLGDEILMGRKRAWPEREADARLDHAIRTLPGVARMRSLLDTAFGSRPEKQIAREAIDRFTQDILRNFKGDAKQLDQATEQIHGIIGAWHDWMKGHTVAKFQKYRRIGLVPPAELQRIAMESLGADRPQWLNDWLIQQAESGIKHPFAEAWRRSDNRIRAYWRQQPGGMKGFLDSVYDSGVGRTAHEATRNLTVGYHMFRFLMDLRWLGLETIESPTLVLMREGPGAMLEGLGKGKNAGRMPMFMGKDVAESMRNQWAYWMANSDVGGLIRTRERYLLAIVRRYQEAEFPRAIAEFQRAMERAGDNLPDLQQAMKMNGHSTMDWLRELDSDWQLAASRGRELAPGEAERLFKPMRDRGTISEQEYQEFVKANRYTGHPAIDRELAYLADPRMGPMLERLAAINEQGWNDAAQLIFGQTDRSNVQRIVNHPLLYWPVSYQIKATKWLAGLLFDRAFGLDTGSAGAVTLGMLHQMHKDRLASDPEYAQRLADNPTLLFAAQMLFPIAPWDLGVGLSPFTRLALAAATNDDPSQGYRRNILAIGPGYTYFSLLPRLFYEQSKPGALLQGMGPLGDLARAGQRIFPYSIPIAPGTGQLGNAERQVYGNAPLPPDQPFQQPPNRVQ